MIRISIISITLIFIVFTQGCSLFSDAESDPSTSNNLETDSFIHTVNYPGETLDLIARWYTGDSRQIERLRQDNPELSNELLALGSRVQIAKEILKTNKILPVEYVKKNSGESSSPFILNTPLKQIEISPTAEPAPIQDIPPSTETIPQPATAETLGTPNQTMAIPSHIFDELKNLEGTQTPEAVIIQTPVPLETPRLTEWIPPTVAPTVPAEPTISDGRRRLLEQLRRLP